MAPVPEDNAALSRPGPDASGPSGPSMAAGSLHLPLSPVAADRIRWVSVVATLVAAVALLAAQDSGYAATLGVTLVLSLAVAWGWPLLSGSWTPTATTVVLAVAAVAIVLSALREDLLWVPAAVAFGIVLAFAGQLVRRSGREGLVLTLLSSFGGLVVIASGTTAVVAADTDRGQAVAVVAMAAVAAAVVTDLLSGVRVAAPLLGFVALAASVLAAVIAASRFAEVGTLEALGIGAATGTVSWSFRRVLALQPAMLTVRGQVGAGVGSVLVVGAVVHLFAVLT
ncbi:hypothetical protein GCM10022399_03040 [Terrabacter ginsenosidimutans]|uniref:Sulfate exporter family transporter n=1 Tax=Terrabacter ginsenosidimutans TaxID=490575 RepID=A0ABP7CL65_9MICO